MNIVKFAISRPVAVTVILILIVLFGVISLTRLPYQLTPNVSNPEISVMTRWSGATPYEVESEVVEPQERVLKNIENLEEYESTSSTGSGRITLRFKLGTDLQKAILDVSNKLNEVRSYPENVEKPVIRATGESVPPAVWLMVQTVEGNDRDIATYQTFLDNEVTEHFERIEGVSELFIRGGVPDELHITLDPDRLAAFGLTIDSVANTITRSNYDISAGSLDLGRRTYRARTASKFVTLSDLENIVLISDGEKRVMLKDVAKITRASQKKTSLGIFMGKPGISIGIRPEVNTNIVEMTDRVEAKMHELNEQLLKKHGIQMVWNYDQRPYILGAIDLVKQNILYGAILAFIVLLLFLRAITPTLIVAIAIPMSVIGTFIVLDLMGRSLNIISLAGISFSVGMLVDSAIVVLENIDRHRRMGKKIALAAYDGTNEVWGALLISALTTIAVFVPIIFLSDEAGQLFRDIAIAVTASLTISLFISILAIPMLWRAMMSRTRGERKPLKIDSKLISFGNKLSDFFMKGVDLTLRNNATKLSVIMGFTAISVITAWLMMPKMEYLPEGNRNLVQNIFITPPGLAYKEVEQMGYAMFRQLEPHLNRDHDGVPAISRAYFVGGGSFVFLGAASSYEDRAAELIPLLRKVTNQFPGVNAITKQAGVFERRFGTSRSVSVDVSGENMDAVTDLARKIMGATYKHIDGVQIRPVPTLDMIYPEITIRPNDDRLKANNLDARSLGVAADVLLDGRKISEFQGDGIKKIDIILKSKDSDIKTPEDLANAQFATPKGNILSISDLATVELGQGMSEIRHFNGDRTISLFVSPPKEITIQEVMEIIDKKVVPSVKDDDSLQVRLSGTADRLMQTVGQLKWNFILAVVITYLLMAAMFGNFIYPIVILFTVPLATMGGFLGLKLTNMFIAYQPLDILTMLGFIILVGVVINNTILIVHQALNFLHFDGLDPISSIKESVKSRLRPIYMSTLTSVFGMIPLVIMPGPGSEMYRGLGSVITGGLMVSTIFTIFVTPALLSYILRKKEKITFEESEI